MNRSANLEKSTQKRLKEGAEAPEKTAGDYASRAEILQRLDLDDALLKRARKVFPVQWPRAYLNLIGDDPQRDPIARMGRPLAGEFRHDAGDLADPIADRYMRPIPQVVRKHEDRIIVLVTKRCHFYCRFCFRREEPPSSYAEMNEADWQMVLAFLRRETGIREVILSGGDPLTLANGALFWIKAQLEKIPHLQCWRIHTRSPVHFAQRVDGALVEGLAGGLPLRMVTHFNHARELTAATRRQSNLLARFGIPFLNQAVLLRGVNDSLTAQLGLWRGLSGLGIEPYYLHHPDRVPGNADFRVTLAEGKRIYRDMALRLRNRCPRYVLDLPDGRGKVPVMSLRELGQGRYRYDHPGGGVSHYTDWAKTEMAKPPK